MTEPSTHLWTGDNLSDADFTTVTELLRNRRHFDLGQYKDRYIRRRIAKRLRICQVANVAAYLKRLEMDCDELDTLLATISIHVSQFFRNPDTFRILEQIILPDLCHLARAAGRNQLTLWSAGCASGEEPYSLALLVDDMAANDLDIRILATDISNPVLETARKGVFEGLRLKEVPAAVIDKYFRIVNGRYQLIERIRDKVEFRRHNIMTAGDFPTADLILCRNVLIYFTRAEQERILARFIEALSEDGALVLGRSETMPDSSRDHFRSEYPVERIYRRTPRQVASPVFTRPAP